VPLAVGGSFAPSYQANDGIVRLTMRQVDGKAAAHGA
jgi:hypothetical protein